MATDYTDFSPRIGFAAKLDPKTVLRGGFGYSYYPVTSQTQVENVNPPFNYSCFPCFGSAFGTLPTPSSDANNPVGTVSTEVSNLKNGYVRQLNLFLQREVAGNSFSVGGVGIQGRRALYLRNYDLPLPPGPGAATPAFVYAAQLPNLTDMQYVDNSGYFELLRPANLLGKADLPWIDHKCELCMRARFIQQHSIREQHN